MNDSLNKKAMQDISNDKWKELYEKNAEQMEKANTPKKKVH